MGAFHDGPGAATSRINHPLLWPNNNITIMKSNVAEVEKDLPAPSMERNNAALSATTHSQVIESTPTLPICVVTTTDEKAHEKPDLQAQVRQNVTGTKRV